MSAVKDFFYAFFLFWFLILTTVVSGSCNTVQHKPIEIDMNKAVFLKDVQLQDIPLFPDVAVINAGAGFDPKAVSEALITYMETYFVAFQPTEAEAKEVFKALNSLTIVFKEDNWSIFGSAYNERGQKVATTPKQVRVRGLTKNRGLIIVSKKEGKISQSSFIHEINHAVIWSLTGDGDADHLGEKIPGWTQKHSEIKDLVNSTLAIKGY